MGNTATRCQQVAPAPAPVGQRTGCLRRWNEYAPAGDAVRAARCASAPRVLSSSPSTSASTSTAHFGHALQLHAATVIARPVSEGWRQEPSEKRGCVEERDAPSAQVAIHALASASSMVHCQ